MAFSDHEGDDGSILASTDDEAVRVWNILSGECLHRLSVNVRMSPCVKILSIKSVLFCGSRLLMISHVVFVSYPTKAVY